MDHECTGLVRFHPALTGSQPFPSVHGGSPLYSAVFRRSLPFGALPVRVGALVVQGVYAARMDNTQDHVQRNAARVADGLVSDWRNAYLIACSVRLGAGNGRPSETSRASEVSDGKTSAIGFARMVAEKAGGKVYGMGDRGVRAALTKWDLLAPRYGLPTSDQLTPADGQTEPDYPDREWKADDHSAEVARSKVDDIIQNPTALERAIRRSPRIAEVARQAIEDIDQGREMRRQVTMPEPDDYEIAERMAEIDRRNSEIEMERHMVQALFHIAELSRANRYDRLRVISEAVAESLVGAAVDEVFQQ